METDRQSMSEHVGSNMWAVRPEKSASRKALMFINPHQPFFGPGQWYEGHLTSDQGWNLLGACFFGSPFPSLGYNGHIAWSHTVNNPDVVDLYSITFDDKADPLKYRSGDGTKQATAWTDEVLVKDENGVKRRRFRFRKTHHGPLVAVRDGKPLAVRLAKLEDSGAIDQAYAMGRARSVAEFKDAMRRATCRCSTQSSLIRGGNIFYVYNGAVPRRSTKFDWTKPVDGSNPETDWHGYHRFDELPQVENPKCGFLQNCNQSPLSTTPVGKELHADEVDENPKQSDFPPYLMATERERDNPRARISRRILLSKAKFAYDDWTRDGFDTKILEAELRIPDLVKEWDALRAADADRAAKLKEPVDVLKNWDCTSAVDSIAMTLFTEAYDRALKMAAKRDVQNYPRVRGPRSNPGRPGKDARHLEGGLGQDQSPAKNPRIPDRSHRQRRVSRRSAEFANRRRTGATGRCLQLLHAAPSRPDAPLWRGRPFVRRGGRACQPSQCENDSSIRPVG